MVSKSTKPTNDEILAQFDNLGVDDAGTTTDESTSKPTNTNTNTNTKTTNQPTTAKPDQEDPLAELDNLASKRPVSTEPRPSIRSPRPGRVGTPPSTGPSSEERSAARKSQESGRSSRAGQRAANVQPSVTEEKRTGATPETASKEGGGGGGGWLGGIFATASAAMKQAETAVKEIQNNEEAQKWAQQVKGNVGALRELGSVI